MSQIIARVNAARGADGALDMKLAAGILGTAKKPQLTLSKTLDAYWDFAADKTQGKSPDQIRRWRNPRIKSFKNLIDVVGDLALTDISADDL